MGTKDEIRLRYGVSNGTTNEALRILQARGRAQLVRGPRGGVFVAEPAGRVALANLLLGFDAGSADMRDCLAVRDALEPLVAADAAKHRTKADLKAMSAALADMAGADDPAAYLRANWNLHRTVAAAGKNRVAQRVYTSLLDFLYEELDDVAPVGASAFTEGRDENLAIHRDLVVAIEQRDPAEAVACASRHVEAVHLERRT